MALIRSLRRDVCRPLLAACTMGRSETCALVTDEPFASTLHARLSWNGAQWELKDLGSTNGTYVDGERLVTGQARAVTVGQSIGLGEATAAWRLEDDGAPSIVAEAPGSKAFVTGRDDLLVLPSEDDPQVSIHAVRGRWVVEDQEGVTTPLPDSRIVQVARTTWRIHLPERVDATPHVDLDLLLDRIAIRFEVSSDEERVEPVIVMHGREARLVPREHSYLLLTLARARLDDEDRPPAERGWRSIAELSKMLRLDPPAINVSIHRARRQFGEAGLVDPAGLVEVARGRRRLGVERVTVVRMAS